MPSLSPPCPAGVGDLCGRLPRCSPLGAHAAPAAFLLHSQAICWPSRARRMKWEGKLRAVTQFPLLLSEVDFDASAHTGAVHGWGLQELARGRHRASLANSMHAACAAPPAFLGHASNPRSPPAPLNTLPGAFSHQRFSRTGCLGSAPCAPAPAQNRRTKGPGSSLANQSQGSASARGEGREAGSQEPWEKAAVPRHARGKAGWCCREPAVSQPRSPALGTASEVPADPRSGTVGRQRCVAGEDKSGVRFQKG